jgi:hypothetical protein
MSIALREIPIAIGRLWPARTQCFADSALNLLVNEHNSVNLLIYFASYSGGPSSVPGPEINYPEVLWFSFVTPGKYDSTLKWAMTPSCILSNSSFSMIRDLRSLCLFAGTEGRCCDTPAEHGKY